MDKPITLVRFLNTYLNIDNENLSKITHKDIKELMPNLKRCSFKYAIENKELVYSGHIILVKDRLNNVVPYIKPNIITTKFRNNVSMTIKENKVIKDIYEMSNNELYKVMVRTKSPKQLKELKKEIKNRKKMEEKKYDKHKRK